MRLSKILTNARQVFESGLGTLKGMKAKIEVREDANPRFHKARPVPYASPDVEAE